MVFEHTTERDAYLAASGKVILMACPGSGKTTTVAYKLSKLINHWEKTNGRFSGIACLSFTNIAKDEINAKFRNFSGKDISFPHIVSTIDSFINQYITLPFYYLFQNDFDGRPKILEDITFLNSLNFGTYSIVTNGGKRPLRYVYQPSAIVKEADNTFGFNHKKVIMDGPNAIIFQRYCNAIKEYQFKKGLLSNHDSTYVALNILCSYPDITKLLVRRFPLVIIDEAQDTSGLQDAIIAELIKNGLIDVELVGDPYQCLYEWRDASPGLFRDKYHSPEWVSCDLTDCRRSTQKIVDCYSLVRCSADPLIKSKQMVAVPENICVIVYADGDEDNLVQEYKSISSSYKKSIIVVRGDSHLKAFKAKADEQNLWKIEPSLPLELIKAKKDWDTGSVRKAVVRVRKCLPQLLDMSVKDNMQKQAELLEEIAHVPEHNARIVRMIAELPSFDLDLVKWTSKVEEKCHVCFHLSAKPKFQLKEGRYRAFYGRKMSDIFQEGSNSNFVRTIHSVKGMTFESLMLILSKNSSGANISMSDITISDHFLNEKQRLIYVAMSRPKFQLVIAIPQSTGKSDDDIKSSLGENITIKRI